VCVGGGWTGAASAVLKMGMSGGAGRCGPAGRVAVAETCLTLSLSLFLSLSVFLQVSSRAWAGGVLSKRRS
jgi:hypothetical protein